MIDLKIEVGLWKLHRVSAVALLALMGAHLLGWLGRAPGGFDPARVEHARLFYGLLATVALVHAGAGLRLLWSLCPRLWPPPAGRRHFLPWCVVAQRWCGLALAGFLVGHFMLIGLAAGGSPLVEDVVRRAGPGLLTVAEAMLVPLLSLHVVGGVRVMVHELFGTTRLERPLTVLAVALAVIGGAIALLRPL